MLLSLRWAVNLHLVRANFNLWQVAAICLLWNFVGTGFYAGNDAASQRVE